MASGRGRRFVADYGLVLVVIGRILIKPDGGAFEVENGPEAAARENCSPHPHSIARLPGGVCQMGKKVGRIVQDCTEIVSSISSVRSESHSWES